MLPSAADPTGSGSSPAPNQAGPSTSDPADRNVAIVACASAAICAAVAFGVLGGFPHVQDEAAYLFQARLLASMRLWADPPVLGATVPFTFVDDAHRYLGAFPAGWPAVLAIGVAIGRLLGLADGANPLPALVNPLLTGLAVWRVGRLAGRVAGPDARLPAALVLGLCPQVILLGASMMSHALVLLLAVRAMELVQPRTGDEGRRWLRGLELGAWIGLCFLARPLCGALLGVGLLAWRPGRVWATALVPIVLAIGVQAWMNHAISGDVGQWPIDTYNRLLVPERPGCADLGFGPDRGCAADSAGYTPADALRAAALNLRSWLWLLPGPLPLLGLLSPAGRRCLRPALAFAALVIAAYGLYWYGGTCYGARFWHLALPLFAVAAGAGIAGSSRRSMVQLVVGGAQLAALFNVLPELVGYWGVDDRFARLTAEWSGPPAVILVRSDGAHPVEFSAPISGVSLVTPASFAWRSLLSPDPDALLLFGSAAVPNLKAAKAMGRPAFVYLLRDDPRDDALGPASSAP